VPQRHAIKVYRGVKVNKYEFLTFALHVVISFMLWLLDLLEKGVE
jgi:hypothetical protein